MKLKTTVILIFALFLVSGNIQSQSTDSLLVQDSSKAVLNKKKVYSHARRATVMSAILPGLGQAYNKKYWKMPIIYAGMGGFAYMYLNNNEEYIYYRDNLRAIHDGDSSTTNTTNYQDWQLQSLKDQYKKNRDLALIGFFAVYLLNIIDANVDGHLHSFDVSDDLSLSMDPYCVPRGIYTQTNKTEIGMRFTLNFK